jgi:glycosyltransferase involved in cell wall biosynthesis
MIVKNEEKLLPKAIESVKPIIDELLVVDTGSTDRTIDVAKKYGATVIPYKWNDNFAEARNVSIRNAKSDWILVLDADETIAKSDLDYVKELTHNDKYLGYFFTQRNYAHVENVAGIQLSDNDKYKESKAYVGWTESQLTRLFRNMPEIKYEEYDYVHEDVAHSILKLGEDKITRVDVPIHHFGRVIRSYGERLKWSDMYIRIGLRKLDDKIKAKASGRELAIACYEIGNSYGFKQDLDNALKYFKMAADYDNKFRPALSNIGRVYAGKGDLDSGARYLQKALSIRDEDDEIIADDYLFLAKIYINKKEILDKAIPALMKCLEYQPDNVEAGQMMKAVEGIVRHHLKNK